MCSIIDATSFFSYNGSHMQPASLVSKSIQTTKSMIKAGVVLISILGVVGFFMRSIQGETRKIPSMAEGLIRLEKKQEVQIRAIEAYDKKNKTTYALISRSMTCRVSGYFCENSYGFDREKFKDSKCIRGFVFFIICFNSPNLYLLFLLQSYKPLCHRRNFPRFPLAGAHTKSNYPN